MGQTRPCKVSIFTCYYNHALYLPECAASVFGQNFTDWEWLTHDDGSTDGSWEYLSGLRDDRIRMRRAPHRGPHFLACFYNGLLEDSRGEWIAFLDSDDVWEPGSLERRLEATREEVVLVHGDVWLMDSQGRRSRHHAPLADGGVLRNVPLARATQWALERLNFPCLTLTVLVRRSAILKAGGFPEGPGHWDFNYPLGISLLGPFAYLPEPLACWRRHVGSITMDPGLTREIYRGNLAYSQRFMDSKAVELKGLGLDRARIESAQTRYLKEYEDAGLLIYAQSLLDVEAWTPARRIYQAYWRQSLPWPWGRESFWILSMAGWISAVLRWNAVRPLIAFKTILDRAVRRMMS